MLEVLDVQDVCRSLVVGERHGSDDRPGEVPDGLPLAALALLLIGGGGRASRSWVCLVGVSEASRKA